MGFISCNIFIRSNIFSCFSSSSWLSFFILKVVILIKVSSNFGRNSCKGGSNRRIITGSPCITFKIPIKSLFCIGKSLSSSICLVSLWSAIIIACITGNRSGAINMCSVLHKPMPSAPKSLAFWASSGVSALA